jgi:hypothetical protein
MFETVAQAKDYGEGYDEICTVGAVTVLDERFMQPIGN